ncbi:hypothetical protein FHR24_000751 [Wenyingzhuangia heitensis]|uniref:EpsG family protein n=1 Tax=Wenyingzhuangia heitensis TaxID=1487859 RepID=A0ABX0UB73_9FLAO|nr:EpsG family protein [Wenyingzhuangia heitensis]NIJ44312.1 hypothetical protein [Wenyingzhuangia heitensis]
MYLYVIFFTIAIFALVEANFGDRSKKFKNVFLLLMGLLFSLSFLRWERGTDWKSYYFHFIRIKNWDTNVEFEFLFSKLYKFVKLTLNGDYTVFLICCAIIIYYTNYKTILKYAKYPITTLLVWYSFTFGGIFFTRQLIAISIVFYSIQFIIQKQRLYFLGAVFIAMLFHRTAIVFALAYIVYFLNFSRKKILLTLGVFCVLGLFFSTGVLSSIGSLLGGFFEQRITAYTKIGTSSSFGSNYSPLQTLVRGSVYRLAIILYVLIFYFDSYKKDVFFRGVFNLYVVGCLLFFVMAPLSPTLIRLSLYFEAFQVFIFPYFIFTKKQKTIRVFGMCLLIFYLLFRFYGVIQTYKDLYVPYKSIFNKSLPVKVY